MNILILEITSSINPFIDHHSFLLINLLNIYNW